MSESEQYAKQRRHAHHQNNLSQPAKQEGETAEILRALSDIQDLPINPQDDQVMGQLISSLASTSNLTSEQVRSNEWVREYILILYLCKFPRQDGMHSEARAWAHGSRDAAREPLDSETRTMLEALISNSKLALSRSEDAKVIEESTRNVSESIVSDSEDGNSGGGGLLGRIR